MSFTPRTAADRPSTSGGTLPRRGLRRRTAAVVLAAATSAMLAVVGGASASADVSSGAGGSATTIAQCSQSHTLHRASQIAYVYQEAAGQTVGVQYALLDANGWHYSAWSTSTGSARFSSEWTGLSGYTASVYARYAWYETTGWKVSGWDRAHYTSIFGGTTSTCAI